MVSAAVDLSGLEVRWAGARGAPSTTVLDGFDLTVELVETAQERVEFKVPRALREPA